MHVMPIRPRRAATFVALILLAVTACEQQTPQGASRAPSVVPVVTAVAETRSIADRIEAVGTTRASESLEITARVSNVVTRIGFDEGSFVEKGQVLIELESTEARARLAEAEADLAEIRTQYQRTQELIRSNAVSQSQLDQQAAQMKAAEARVAAARAALADHTLRAPFAGRAGLRRVSIGSMVTPGTVITTLDKVDEMNLDFAVPESYLAVLEQGLTVQARTVAFPDETFEGVVRSVDSRIDPVTRMVTVRARLENSERRLRPGMFMTVILEKAHRDAVVIPEIALVSESGSKYVFVLDEQDAVVRREVELGARQRGVVEIVKGLEAGTEFVVEGTQSLRHGVSVRRVGERS